MTEDWSSILERDLQKLSEVVGVQPVKTEQLIPGERRDVAILFLDLKGFTAMSETMDHEMVHKVIGGVMQALSNVVKGHGGYVDKFEGDLIMALFGARTASDNDCIRAVACGLKMFDVLREVNQIFAGKGYELGARCGISYGAVKVAPDPKGNLTAMGDEVNLASRMESTAEVNTVQVTARVQKESGDYFQWEDLAFGLSDSGASQVWKVNLKTGKTHHFEKSILSSSFQISWAPGQNILYQKPGNRNFTDLNPETGIEKDLIQDESVGWIFSPNYSPDQKNIAVFWNHKDMRGLWVLTVQDSMPDKMAIPLIEGSVFPVGWSQDSKLIYTNDSRNKDENLEILIVSAEDGSERNSFRVPFENAFVTTMSADEKTFACSVWEFRSDVWVVKNFDPDIR